MFYLFHVFRSFLPLRNPIGFGAADFVEFAAGAILLILVLARGRAASLGRRLAERTGWSMLFCAALPVALRLALLPLHPAPTPSAADDTSYLLLGDTLRHFRLANPVHPFHRFFESNFVLQEPAYSSIFPIGQGIVLAIGALFAHPWVGVLLSEAAFCALCYWMLRAWVGPGWALLGGVLAGFEFGPLSYWMNSYWGGAVSGIAGCLVFGALGRLRTNPNIRHTRDSVLLGVGLGAQLLTRPYECVFLVLIAGLFLLSQRPFPSRAALVAAIATLPALALTFAHNKAVTGSWTTLPYQLSRYEYGVPATFTTQPNAAPHRDLTPEQDLGYQAQVQVHDRESAKSFAQRLLERARYARFFFLPAFYVALPVIFLSLGDRRLQWAIGSIAIFCAGAALYPYFHPHYFAAIACLFLLLSIVALERMNRRAAPLLLLLALGHFIFWYGVQLSGNQDVADYESWDFVNSGDPEGRIAIDHHLAEAPGNQLVFVRYGPRHPLREWIYNAADIDRARVVWALDLGPAENEELRRYYPDRAAWLVEPDAHPPRLALYP